MMPTDDEILNGHNETAAAAVLGALSIEPRTIDTPDGEDLVVVRNGLNAEVIDLQEFTSGPRESRYATYETVYDPASFIAYMRRYSDPTRALIRVDAKRGKVRGILNYLDGDSAGLGWANHTVTLVCAQTDEIGEWIARDRKLAGQDEFAEFVEDHQPAFVDPDAATMLEIAQSMRGSVNVNWQNAVRLSNGETKFEYIEDVEARAGKRGDLTIPDVFQIGLRLYEGGERFPIEVRLRWRVNAGNLQIGYRMIRLDDVTRAAFDRITAAIRDNLDQWAFIDSPVN